MLTCGSFRRKRNDKKPNNLSSNGRNNETNVYSQTYNVRSNCNNTNISQLEDHTYYNTLNMTTQNNKKEQESKVKTNNIKLSELRQKHSDYENINTTEGSKQITDRGQSSTYHQIPRKSDKDIIEDAHVYEDADDVNVNRTVSLMPTDCEMVDNELYAATNDVRKESKLLHHVIMKEGVNVNPGNLYMEDNCVYESTKDEHRDTSISKKKQEGDKTYMIDNDLYNTTR